MNKTVLTAALLAAAPLLVSAQTPPPPAPAPTPPAPTPAPVIQTTPTTPATATPTAAEPTPQLAATAALVTGRVTVGSGANARDLRAGDAVYEREVVTVGPNSYANLKFMDGGRVLLRPNTEFAVESFRYVGPAPAAQPTAASPEAQRAAAQNVDGTAFFRLARGGFRAISGLLGKGDVQQYRVTTPAATIGIRGTDYETQTCDADCPRDARAAAGGTLVASESLAGLELAQAGGAAGGGGLIVATHEGSIVLRTSRGDFVVDAGQVALALADGQTFRLPVVPDALLLNATPSPEACE